MSARAPAFPRLRLTRRHLWIFLGLLAPFGILTASAVAAGADDGNELGRVVGTTAGTLLGPFTGALARDGQSCCLQFSLSLLPWAGGALLAGFVLQAGARPRAWRLGAWGLGWAVWFASGLVSFLHAFS